MPRISGRHRFVACMALLQLPLLAPLIFGAALSGAALAVAEVPDRLRARTAFVRGRRTARRRHRRPRAAMA